MKKILFIAIAACAITTLSVKVFAQTKITIPGKLENKIQSPFTDSRLVLKVNWPGKPGFSLNLMIEYDKQKGNIVKFTASEPIDSVRVWGEGWTQTTTYNPGTTNCIFYLDSPSYAGWEQYAFDFFIKGVSVYTYGVERKHPAPIQKIPNPNLLKKIPND
ncbi:MAG: hypothetical protein ABIO05_05440 [Ferruginibacter sp.]